MRIKFRILNEWNNYLFQILKGIEFKDYLWKIGEEQEVLEIHGDTFFTESIYDEKNFFQKIQETHYPIFADIRLYKSNGNMNFNISNYMDFMKSDCLLILFVTDAIFVDIYCKDDKLLKIIYNNAIENGFNNIELISSDDNVRKRFNPYYD